MAKVKQIIPGILLCLAIAIPAWACGQMFPIIGGPIFSILAGMVIANYFPHLTAGIFEKGIHFTYIKLLQYSIVLLGFEMNLFNVISVGKQAITVIICTVTVGLIVAYIAGRMLKISNKAATLVGIGTSICGGSAIATTAPVINANEDDTERAISTIFLFNIISVFLFPALGYILGMNAMNFGLWAGTSISDTSSVVAASTVWAHARNNADAIYLATIVKLTRTLMIVPITLFLEFRLAQKDIAEGKHKFKFWKVFPWFIVFFVLATMANTFAGLSSQLINVFVDIGKFVIIMAMATIGLNTNFKKLFSRGLRPIAFGFCCWIAIAVTSFIVQKLI